MSSSQTVRKRLASLKLREQQEQERDKQRKREAEERSQEIAELEQREREEEENRRKAMEEEERRRKAEEAERRKKERISTAGFISVGDWVHEAEKNGYLGRAPSNGCMRQVYCEQPSVCTAPRQNCVC